METNSEENKREKMRILCNHCGNEINDVYQNDSTPDEVVKELHDEAKKQAKQKVL